MSLEHVKLEETVRSPEAPWLTYLRDIVMTRTLRVELNPSLSGGSV